MSIPHEIKKVKEPSISQYNFLELIGRGTYGDVYKATDLERGKIVAIKRIPMIYDGDALSAEREITILQKYRHMNLLGLNEIIRESNQIYVVVDYYNSDLNKQMTKQYLTMLRIKSYLYQILVGIKYLHENDVIHLDLKPENLLIDENGGLVIADFGATLEKTNPDFYPKVYKEMVTLWYRPPELLFYTLGYTPAIDIWSIGCIFAEMVKGIVLFGGSDESDQLQRIFYILGTPNNNVWPGIESNLYYRKDLPKYEKKELGNLVKLDEFGLDLLGKMLTYDPTKRISAKDALKHPYFDDLLEIYKRKTKFNK